MQKVAVVGGSERHILSLLPALRERGIDVKFLGLVDADPAEFVDASHSAGLDFELVSLPRDTSPAAAIRVMRAIRRYQPDIVHTHLIHAHIYGQFAASILRLPSVATAHNAHNWYRRPPIRMALKLAHGKANTTIAVSQHAARHLNDLRITHNRRVVVIPHGLRTPTDATGHDADADALRYRLGLHDVTWVIGMAARLIDGKGHDAALEALAIVRSRGVDAHLLIAGSGPLKDRLAKTAELLHPPGAVQFLGYQKDIGPFLRALDVLVIPTETRLSEGFGLAALDAMACGVPVVATRVGSLPEIVRHETTGLLVEPGDVRALADALLTLHDDREYGSKLGENAHSIAHSDYSLDATVDRIVDVYHHVRRT